MSYRAYTYLTDLILIITELILVLRNLYCNSDTEVPVGTTEYVTYTEVLVGTTGLVLIY